MINLFVDTDKYTIELNKAKYILARLNILRKETKSMKVTLANGVVVEGTLDQIQQVARSFGVSIGNDGVYYNSSSKGLVRIVDMENTHLRNAMLKLYREWVENLKIQSNYVVADRLRNGPTDKTFVAFYAEFLKRVDRGLM